MTPEPQRQDPQAWLLAQAAVERGALLAGQVSGLLGTALACAQAALLAWALQAAIFASPANAHYGLLLAGLPCLALVRAWLMRMARDLQQRAAGRVVSRVRETLLAQVQRLGPAWLAHRDSGELTTRLVDGVEALEPYISRYLPQTRLAMAAPLLIVLVSASADWVAALSMALSLPLILLFMGLSGSAAAAASQRRWQVLTRLGSQFMDVLQGLNCLRLFDARAGTAARLAAASDAYRRETMGVLKMAFLSSAVLEFFAALSVAVVAVWVGFRLYWGRESFAHGMLALLLAPECYLPLRSLGALRHVKMDAQILAEEAVALLATRSPASAPSRPWRLPTGLPPAIELVAVQLRHPEARGGLAGVHLQLAAGRSTALVGESGAGKSSILYALLGFAQPAQGMIIVDGVDLAEYPIDEWRRQLSWLPQRPYLFAGTVRENLRFARPEAKDAELAVAARWSMFEPVLGRLPQGWDTPLGEHGHGLSGGEAQRLALARVFLRDTPLLLLDEPCQHLDPALAKILAGRLHAFARGRTVVSAVHRLWQADTADHIAVIAGGRVCEFGSPTELHARKGAYAELWACENAA